MTSFDIGLYPTQQLTHVAGSTPIERAEMHIDDALNPDSEHSVTIHTGFNISAPIEPVGPSFTTERYPCTRKTRDEYYWNDIGEWWDIYTRVCGSYGDDAAILITDGGYYDTVGITYNNYACVCEGGRYLSDLPANDTGQGSGTEYDVISTVLHELGHAIISANVNEHKVYDTYQSSSGDWGKTAMDTGAIGPISYNECGDPVHSATPGQVATGYSECAERKM